ncbi:MAG: xanthine dehydrogenase accessory factor [Halioglobus sp.]|jgi:xanthine dehydrogenase accessory factor
MQPLNTHRHWAEAADLLQRRGEDYVLVTVLSVRGSTPRDAGSKMLFSHDASFGSIGGGHLEYKAAQIAAKMINQNGDTQHLEYFPLGPKLGQCCGGSAHVLFESFKGHGMNIMLFGAGHVGQALAPILEQLPCQLKWVDSREAFASITPTESICALTNEYPAEEVADMPPGSWYLIMTHNHQQDYDILRAVIDRKDAAYIGLIGSDTKWRRFQMRLQHQGYKTADYETVHCPIGLESVPGKLPMEVAVSVAAQVITVHHSSAEPAVTAPTLDRKALTPLLLSKERTQKTAAEKAKDATNRKSEETIE